MTGSRRHIRLALAPAALLAALLASPAAPGEAAPSAIALRLANAEALFREGDFAGAGAEYRACLSDGAATTEESARAIAGGAAVLAATGDNEAAATAFRRAALTLPRTNAFARACQVFSADALHRAGLFAEAADAYDEAASAYGDDQARLMAADAHERAGNIDKSEANYRAAAEAAPTEARGEILLRLAALLERAGRPRDAERACTAALDGAAPDLRPRILLARARARSRDGAHGLALADLESIGEEAGHDGEAAFLRILALQGLGRGADAADAADAFLAAAPEPPPKFAADILLWRATICYGRGDYTAARDDFSAFASKWPRRSEAPRARLLAGVSAFRDADFSTAARDFVHLAKEFPDSPLVAMARMLQAKSLAALARFEDAVLVLDDLIARNHGSALAIEAAVLRGDALVASSGASDKFHEAAESYLGVLAQDGLPKDLHDSCLRKLVRCLADSGRPDDLARARSILSRLDESYPSLAAEARAAAFGRRAAPDSAQPHATVPLP